jgi:outer membrane protein assembly factor BamB
MAWRWLPLAVLLVATCSDTYAGDWPWFHGPTHDRHATGERLQESWPVEGPPVVWARSLGVGYSSFVVAGGRAFTQTQSLYDQAVECLDARTGATIWRKRYALPYDGGGLYPGPRSTPAVVDGNVYFHSPEGIVGCLRAEDGDSFWSVNLQTEYGLRGVDFGCASSPLVLGGRVYIPAGGAGAMLVALDAATGKLVWKSGEHPASYATPQPIVWQGQTLLIVPGENTLAAFHAETGELWWELELSTGYDEHSCAPLYREPRLMLASPFRAGARQWELVANAATGRCRPVEVWDNPKFSNDVASSVLVDEAVFGFDLKDAQSRLNRASRGEFRCLDWSTGRILWSTRDVGHASAIVADGKLILFDDVGRLTLARVDREAWRELGRHTVLSEETCWSAPALSEGYLFIRSPTRAVCLDLGVRDGSPASPRGDPVRHGQATTGPRTKAAIVIPAATRRFDPTWLLGGEREYPATTPELAELWTWYGWSMVGMAGAAVIAIVVGGFRSRHARDRLSPDPMPLFLDRTVFWSLLVAWGAAGSPILNRSGSNVAGEERYVFLWPLLLWAAMEAALVASRAAHGASFRSLRKWRSYAVGCSFLVVCGVYFHLCRLLGLAPEWSFLAGFVTAFPLSWVGVWLESAGKRGRMLLPLLMAGLSFSAFFWSSVWFMKWRMVLGS